MAIYGTIKFRFSGFNIVKKATGITFPESLCKLQAYSVKPREFVKSSPYERKGIDVLRV